jgi:uroporphyrin-III C-methyltransferase
MGAGPGAADLLTVRGLRALQNGDVVIHDALVSEEVLALAAPHSRKIAVGKRGHRASTSQAFINRLIVKLARSGVRVVRLKGGDPSIFGRSFEEMTVLKEAHIEVEIIPGITTASAAAAQFGFSLTKRGHAQQVLFLTGRTALGPQTSFASAADPHTTICLYMGCGDCEAIVSTLIAMGRERSTPALVARNVGRLDAHLVVTTLESLPGVVANQSQEAPGLIMIGSVCADAQSRSDLLDQVCAHVA